MSDIKSLHIKRGVRTLNIKGYNDHKNRPVATITCVESWDDDGSGLYEDTDDNQWATFYLKESDIDAAIDKLKELKQFLSVDSVNQSHPDNPDGKTDKESPAQ